MKSLKFGTLLSFTTCLHDFLFCFSFVCCTALKSYMLLSGSLTGHLPKEFFSRLAELDLEEMKVLCENILINENQSFEELDSAVLINKSVTLTELSRVVLNGLLIWKVTIRLRFCSWLGRGSISPLTVLILLAMSSVAFCFVNKKVQF